MLLLDKFDFVISLSLNNVDSKIEIPNTGSYQKGVEYKYFRLMNGIIFNIKRYALHDGPGIRTTVFMKGCPMKCLWCHNPESQRACIEQMQKINKIGLKEFCETVNIGYEISVKELVAEIEKDHIFYEESQGGVTFSGGEPLLQKDFLLEALKMCKQKNIHTCIDTCGYSRKDSIAEVAAYTDLFLYDIKHLNESSHLEYTGVSNKKVLENLRYLSDKGKEIIIRIPVIPGYNDSLENITATIDLVKSLSNIREVNILPYHNLGKEKYAKLGLNNPLGEMTDMPKDKAEVISLIFKENGRKCRII